MESFLNGQSGGHHSGTLVLVAIPMMKIELLLTIAVSKLCGSMSPHPLETLKKGFSELFRNIKDRKGKLNVRLSQGEAISPSDKQWLDNEGNTIDDERILEALELAPDYNKAVAKLDSNEQEIMRKLREWAGCGSSAKVVGKKWMCLVWPNLMFFRPSQWSAITLPWRTMLWHKNLRNS